MTALDIFSMKDNVFSSFIFLQLSQLELLNMPIASLPVGAVRLSPINVLDMTQRSDVEGPFRKLSGVWSTPSLIFLPEPPWLGVVVSVKALSRDQIELFNHLTACKQKIMAINLIVSVT